MGPIGLAALGIGSNVAEGAGNLIFNGIAQKQQLKGQKKALEQQNAAQLDMWNKTNYGAQMKHLKDAGLNPALIYGMSGGGATTTGSANANVDGARQTNSGMGIEAMNIALLKAQKEKIEAETNKLKADTTFRAGAETAKTVNEAANLAAGTTNTEAKTALLAVDKRIREMEENILDSTQWYEIGKAEKQWMILTQELRSAMAKANIDEQTQDVKVKQEMTRWLGMMIENRANEKGIELTDAQIDQIEANIQTMIKEAETSRWNAESNAANASTNRTRQIMEISEASGIDFKTVMDMVQTGLLVTQFGKGGYKKELPKNIPPQTRKKYDRWGTKTAPRGYDLK